MRSWIARRMLRATSKRDGYDASYLEMMLKESPSAFSRFARVAKLPAIVRWLRSKPVSRPKSSAPSPRIAVPAPNFPSIWLEAGMPNDQIEAVLRRDLRAMNSATILGFRFADAVVRRSADDDEHRDAIRARWGEKGVIDLTMALQMGRMFPMVKSALGYAKECRRVTVGGHNVDVIKQAA